MVKVARLCIAGFACVATGLTATQVVTKSEAKQPTVIYVNAMEAMQASKEGQAEMAALKKKENDLTASLQKKEEKIKKEFQEYQSKSTTLSASAKEKAENSLLKSKEELEVAAKTSQQELQLASTRATEKLSKEIEDAAVKLGQEEKVDAVVDLFTGRVVWANDKTVKTKEIVKHMDKNYEVKLASGKTTAKAPITIAAANKGNAKSA